MSDQLTLTCIQIVIALTAGLAAVLAFRIPLRRAFGVSHSYMTWLLVPLLPLICLICLCVPDAELPILPAHAAFLSADLIAAAPRAGTVDLALVTGMIWLTGFIGHLALQCLRQSRYLRRTEIDKAVDGIFVANTSGINPALVGVFRPKIIVPADFATRYNEEEQRLIIAHERMHKQRGDHLTNAFSAFLLSLFWFHPLLHFCMRRFRFDQELACDAAVLSMKTNSRKAYANAMLKAATSDIPFPVACNWQSPQLLKERIMQLNIRPQHAFKRNVGFVAVASILATGACLTWAAQSAPTPTNNQYNVVTTITSDSGAAIVSKLHIKEGDTFALTGAEKNHWSGSAKLSLAGSDSVKLQLALAHTDKSMGNPTVIARFGEVAKIRTTDGDAFFEIDVKASPVRAK